MKSSMCAILGILCCSGVLAVVSLSEAKKAEAQERASNQDRRSPLLVLERLSPSFLAAVDSRLAALRAKPELVKALDQQSAFIDKGFCKEQVVFNVSMAERIMPTFLAMKPYGALEVLAVTPGDNRLFFSVDANDYSAVGWTGFALEWVGEIPETHLVMAVVPKAGAGGNVQAVWAKGLPVEVARGGLRLVRTAGGAFVTNVADPSRTVASLSKVLKDAVGITCDEPLILTLDDDLLYSRFLITRGASNAPRKHDIQIWVGRGGFCLKAQLLAEGETDIMSWPTPLPFVYRDGRPGSPMPEWPPK